MATETRESCGAFVKKRYEDHHLSVVLPQASSFLSLSPPLHLMIFFSTVGKISSRDVFEIPVCNSMPGKCQLCSRFLFLAFGSYSRGTTGRCLVDRCLELIILERIYENFDGQRVFPVGVGVNTFLMVVFLCIGILRRRWQTGATRPRQRPSPESVAESRDYLLIMNRVYLMEDCR